MAKAQYKGSVALMEHMLEGHKISRLEAILLFGVPNLTALLTQAKMKGFIIKRDAVPMAKIIRRINEYTVCKTPESLPHKEIVLTEYWISK